MVKGEGFDIESGVRGEDYRPDMRGDGVPTLRRYSGAISRRKWLFLGPLIVLPALTYVLSVRQDPVYQVSADVLVQRQEIAATSLIGQTPALDDADRTMDTQALLARVPVVVQRTVDAVAVETSPSALLQSTTVFPLADLLRFVVQADDGDDAAAIAGEYARQFVLYRRELDTRGLSATLRGVRGQLERLEADDAATSPAYARLVDRESQLESLVALRTSNVSVVQAPTAGDAERVAPRPKRDAALAVAGGLVLSLVLVFLAESLATRPRSEQELEELLGMPFLVRLRFDHAHGADAALLGAEADAIQTLRTRLELANATMGGRTIMVASPRGEEGRGVTAVELARALARAGRRVALVDLDLRDSAVTTLLGLDPTIGVAGVLRGDAALDDALVSVSVSHSTLPAPADVNGRTRLDDPVLALSAGRAERHPAELLGSDAFAEILDDLAQRADVVLVDVPPILEAPDAAAVAPRVDSVVLLVGRASAHAPALVEVARVLESWPAVTLGFALIEGGAGRSYAAGPARMLRPARRAEAEQVS